MSLIDPESHNGYTLQSLQRRTFRSERPGEDSPANAKGRAPPAGAHAPEQCAGARELRARPRPAWKRAYLRRPFRSRLNAAHPLQSAWADVTSSATRPTSSGPFVRSRPARIPSRECRRGGSTASARFRVGAPRPRPGTTRALFSREVMEEPNSGKGSLCECRRGRAPRMYWRLVARQPVAPNGKPFAGLATFAAKHHRIREQLRRNRRPSPRDQRMPQSSFGRPTVPDLAPNSSIISSTP